MVSFSDSFEFGCGDIQDEVTLGKDEDGVGEDSDVHEG